MYKIICRHAGIVDKTNENVFHCYINYDKKFILMNGINRYLYLTVLKRQINHENELEVNVKVHKQCTILLKIYNLKMLMF